MLCIGFSKKYYTLWDVSSVENFIEINGQPRKASTTYNYNYIQNLSIDCEKAKKRFTTITGEKAPEVDEDLYGRNQSWKNTVENDVYKECEMHIGTYQGQKIDEIEDVEYLHWFYNNVTTLKTRSEILKKKLLDNGYYEDPTDSSVIVNKEIYDSILLGIKEKKFYNSLIDGHHLEDKKRLDFDLTVLSHKSFEGYYGICHIYTFYDKNKKKFIYMGGKYFSFDRGDKINIKATVKHDEWVRNDDECIKQTKLLRIKLNNDDKK